MIGVVAPGNKAGGTKRVTVGGLTVAWATNSTAWLISLVLLLGIIAATSCIWRMDFEQVRVLLRAIVIGQLPYCQHVALGNCRAATTCSYHCILCRH